MYFGSQAYLISPPEVRRRHDEGFPAAVQCFIGGWRAGLGWKVAREDKASAIVLGLLSEFVLCQDAHVLSVVVQSISIELTLSLRALMTYYRTRSYFGDVRKN